MEQDLGLFRMVNVEDRLPEKDDNYWTNIGLMAYFTSDGYFGNNKVKWWFEQVAISINVKGKTIGGI